MRHADPAELIRVNEQLARERTAARTIIDEVCAAAGSTDAVIPTSWQTAGTVQEVLAVATRTLEVDPPQSLALARLALGIATTLPVGAYPRTVQMHLEGTTWKEIATAHRYLGQYDAALRALDRADARFGAGAALAHDQAIVVFARAIVLSEMLRYDDALRLLAQTTPVLREFADTRRLGQATLVQAMIYQRTGQLVRARTIYESLIPKVAADLHTKAAAYNNLGDLCVKLGDYEAAVIAVQNARALFKDLGMPAEVTRTDWTLAKVLLATGDWEKASSLLRAVREDFLQRQMPEEAGLAALDLAECQLATNDQAAARTLIETVLQEFRASGLNERAATALAYLRDLLPDTSRARPAVKHVRSYLLQLKDEPARAFLPLP